MTPQALGILVAILTMLAVASLSFAALYLIETAERRAWRRFVKAVGRVGEKFHTLSLRSKEASEAMQRFVDTYDRLKANDPKRGLPDYY